MSQTDKPSNLDIIKNMTLMDDIFITIFFKNRPECVEDILNAVLPFKAAVKSVDTQCKFPNVYGHSVTFDIKAVDEDNAAFNIEIQKRSDGANPKRARFYSSMLDIISFEAQEDYKELNDTYVIFITEKDVLGYKKPLYHINRTISEADESFNDGSHILYINTAYNGNANSKITDLIHDFRCTEADKIRNENLRKRFKELKANLTKEEEYEMCELLELRIKKEREESHKEGREEGREEGRAENSREIAKTMLLSGDIPVEKIAEYCHLTVEEVNELKKTA